MIFGSVYIGVLWHQVKNYYNFQYRITNVYIEFDYRTHAGIFQQILYIIIIIGGVNFACLFESIRCAQYVARRFLMCQTLDCM